MSYYLFIGVVVDIPETRSIGITWLNQLIQVSDSDLSFDCLLPLNESHPITLSYHHVKPVIIVDEVYNNNVKSELNQRLVSESPLQTIMDSQIDSFSLTFVDKSLNNLHQINNVLTLGSIVSVSTIHTFAQNDSIQAVKIRLLLILQPSCQIADLMRSKLTFKLDESASSGNEAITLLADKKYSHGYLDSTNNEKDINIDTFKTESVSDDQSMQWHHYRIFLSFVESIESQSRNICSKINERIKNEYMANKISLYKMKYSSKSSKYRISLLSRFFEVWKYECKSSSKTRAVDMMLNKYEEELKAQKWNQAQTERVLGDWSELSKGLHGAASIGLPTG